MPYGDGTGPDGRGRLTGRQSGYCAGNDRPGCYEPGAFGGRGFFRHGAGFGFRGRGRGFFRGYRDFGYWENTRPVEPSLAPNEEEILKDQVDWLQNQLKAVTERLDQLSRKAKKES